MEIPYGYCHCGCGQRTSIQQRSYKRYGLVKGQPARYLYGHHKLPRNHYQKPEWPDGIPYGFCQCGCGQKTNINTRSNASKKQFRGEPSFFIQGHGSVKPRENIIQPSDLTIRHIALTRGQIAIVDACEFEYLSQWSWGIRSSPTGSTFYAGRVRTEEDGSGPQTILMHVEILKPPIGYLVDHVDGNGLNNRRANLRKATRSQNAQNSRLSISNTSGCKGVCWDKQKKSWAVSIGADGQFYRLGRYKDFDVAVEVRKSAELKYHGEYRQKSH